ncbi:MAG: adenine phosphoribosyltransferase [Candidatus Falkowbacteria bacterium]
MKKYLNKIKLFLSRNRLSLILMRIMQELRITDHDINLSYAQEGEDLILASYLLRQKHRGFYVDIGANHPKKFSNSYLYYLHGWQGIAIDPWPEAKELFARYRPDDIFINCGVANKDADLDYYCFKSSLMNTFSAEDAKSLESDPDEGCRLIEKKQIKVRKLKDILDEQRGFIAGRQIDFMSIDVEGGEMAVLESNDWSRYRPSFIAIEIHSFDLSRTNEFLVHNYLAEKGYELIAKTLLTAIYKYNPVDRSYFDERIRKIPDFPKEGILFYDVTTLFEDAAAFKLVIDRMAERYAGQKIDKIIGIDARGFLLASTLAYKLDAGISVVRKKGKLPFKTIGASYEKEYGPDIIEMHEDTIKPGETVVITDDLLATGGTIMAAVDLVERLGGKIAGIEFLVNLSFLPGYEKLKTRGYRANFLVGYDNEKV